MTKNKDVLAYGLFEVSELIRNKTISPVELMEKMLDRINSIDSKLNSFIEVLSSEEAMRQAKQAEEEIQAGLYKGPLHGIPIGIKDMIKTKEMKTTMGSEIYKDYHANEDAFVVEKLKESGAIIIGKQNTHQFAYGPTGDRSYFGAVHNPYNVEKMTGGSSSGSAAAVAACISYGALGTDTGGSVRIPASFCGIVGMKPTYGRVSKRGVYPLSWNLDHVGPMTRNVVDNALLLNVIGVYDAEDDLAIHQNEVDYTSGITDGVNNITIGLPKKFFFDDMNPEVRESVNNSIDNLRQLGVNFIDIELPDMDEITESQRVLLRADAYELHESHLEEYPNQWDDEVKERLLSTVDEKSYLYSRALKVRKRAKKQFAEVFNQVDAILTPTVPILPPKIDGRYVEVDKYNEEHIRWSILKLTAPTNFTGLPSLSIPCGFSKDGMPIGVQLIGKDFDEALLYRIGYALEQSLSIDTAKFLV
ncbi:Asp-tRNA(Asn)/Glu-tRNA(Gln) amidotransferase GatCAB subunit A [Sporosarcina sp. P26b]|uniref:amidase n=1 Tax=Sporosarcina sp. P26b TaxID=2048253 RepID=UPI000C16495E|nr:amidase [Sporosarcina sp. P26b]PIC94829.1 Asp-tRNA(Asn)/Glu-tRNA(Gln) amidotransferase GatCAB subunit A [Sporosarcina sp. P26b]